MNLWKSRKNLLSILFIFSVVIFLNINVNATNYYVSNDGNNNLTGTSPSTAWQTIDKVNSITFLPGDSILFKAGNIWRETLSITASGTAVNYIVYSRYGTGKNPKFLGSELATTWTESGTSNIWQSATSLDNYSDEYYPGRIFFLEDDSISWGQYQIYNAGFSNLTQENDYTVNGTTYYVYSETDPDLRYDAIEVTQRQSCITIPDNQPQSYLVIDGVDFMFSRIFGFNAGYPAIRGATDLVFKNCTIGYIGAQPSGAAYGLSVWHSNLLVEHCTISDCGRRGISVNFYLQADPGEQRNLSNIIIRNNIFKRGYHTTALDLSSQQTNTDTIQNVYFYHNIVDDSDFDVICDNCGSNQVFFQNGNDPSFTNNIYVVGNVFIGSTARNILFEGVDTSYVWHNSIIGHNPNISENPYQNVGWNSDEAVSYYQNNILYDNLPDNSLQNHGVFIYETFTGVFAEKDYNLYYSLFPKADRNFSAHKANSTGGMGYWRTTEWDDYLAENTLFEQNSPEPGYPNFNDYEHKDYRLTELSPAIEAGTKLADVIVTDPFGNTDNITKYDISGQPYNLTNPAIGAYEYKNLTDIKDENSVNIVNFSLLQNYPNPFNPTTVITYQLTKNGKVSLKVYDINGREVKTLVNQKQAAGKHSVTFNAQGLSSGVYFYKLKVYSPGRAGSFKQSRKMIFIR